MDVRFHFIIHRTTEKYETTVLRYQAVHFTGFICTKTRAMKTEVNASKRENIHPRTSMTEALVRE